MQSAERIEYLRQRFLEKTNTSFTSEEMRYQYALGWRAYQGESTRQRGNMAKKYMLEHITPLIDRYELIVGKPNHHNKMTAEELAYQKLSSSLTPRLVGQTAHMALDYEKLLRLGTSGVKAEIELRLQSLDTIAHPCDLEKQLFYQDCIAQLEALEHLAARYAQHARAQSEHAETAQEKEDLLAVAANLDVVPKYPARTFWQALQSVHFLLFPQQGLYQHGRPDQYLYPYYQHDIQSGVLTPERAQELIDCACVMFNECIGKGLAVGLMVGGRYPDGTDVVNDLTYMYIRSIRHTRLAYPGIGLCVTPRTPDDLLTEALDALAHGCTHPALFNDEVIAEGLMKYGLPFEEAVSYIHSTCVEITPIHRSGVWVASPYYNLMEPLDLLLGVYEGSEPTHFDTFDELLKAYKALLVKRIEAEVNHQNAQQIERKLMRQDPLISCFVDDCLEKGLDINQGGAKYMFIESSFVGMSNLVDALTAIEELVYTSKKLTLEQLRDALKRNFEGDEALRMYILNKIPKYGTGDEGTDRRIQDMTAWLREQMSKYTTIFDSRYIPSMFCWIMHERMGNETPATPDGRNACFPLGDGSGPAQGRESAGLTASVLSSTSWEHTEFIGGVAVNLKFAKSLLSENAYDRMMTLIRTYMKRGGMELQINTVNREELLDAKAHPELHKDLVVRIGGYSDYFTHLPEGMQDEVLLRTAHEI